MRTTLVIEKNDLARDTFMRVIGQQSPVKGAKTLEIAETQLALRQDIGLVLCCIRLPDGLGHKLHQRIAHRLSLDGIQWLAMSADWEYDLHRPAREYYQAAGVPMVDKKDLKPLALFALVRNHLPPD